MKKLVVPVALLAAVAFLSSCGSQTQTQTPTQPDTKAADEAALKKADEEWSKAVGAKDVDKTVSYYAADALVLPPNGTAITAKDAIRKMWQEMITAPAFTGGWTATKVEVARSGEIGYVTGTWEFKWNDTAGKPVSDHGKFVEAWKKQSDGSWKCTVDIWNSDLPLPAPEKK